MEEILCMLIDIHGEESKRFVGFRFKQVESVEPNLGILTEVEEEIGQPHLLPRFRFCRFYTDDETAGREGQVPEIDGVFLHYPGTGFSHLPNNVTFDPEVYYPWATRWTLDMAASGMSGVHRAAATWMRDHECNEAIRSLDGGFHEATPFAVVLDASRAVPAVS